MIDHAARLRQYTSEINSRLQLMLAHVHALRGRPLAGDGTEAQARLWSDLELLATQIRGLADKIEQAGPRACH